MDTLRDFFFQIVLTILGILAGVAVPLLPKENQKAIGRFLFLLLTSSAIVWGIFEYLNLKNSTEVVNATPTVYTIPPMNDELALTMMFDDGAVNQDAQGVYIVRTLSEEKERLYNLENKYVHTDVLFSTSYIEGGINLFFILTQTTTFENSCHACSPVLGGAVFVLDNNSWRIRTKQEFISNIAGDWGQISEDVGELEIIGPDKHGVALNIGYGGMGEEYLFKYIIAETANDLRVVFQTEVKGEFVTCDNVNFKCWGFQTTMEYIRGNNLNYYDIRIQRYGTKYSWEGIIDVTGEEIYSFDGITYNRIK